MQKNPRRSADSEMLKPDHLASTTMLYSKSIKSPFFFILIYEIKTIKLLWSFLNAYIHKIVARHRMIANVYKRRFCMFFSIYFNLIIFNLIMNLYLLNRCFWFSHYFHQALLIIIRRLQVLNIWNIRLAGYYFES